MSDLRVRITGDDSHLQRTLGNSRRRVAAYAAGVTAAAGALALFVRSAMNAADEIAKQARSLGLLTSRYQALSMVAREAGVNQQAFAGMLGRLQQAADSANPALERLGINLRDFATLGADEQMRLVAEALSGVESATERTGIAMQLFGRAGRDALNMLSDYGASVAEAEEFQRRFNISLSEEGAQAIEAANDALARLGDIFTGIGNTLAVWVAPAVLNFANNLIAAAGAVADILRAVGSWLDSTTDLQRAIDANADAQERLNRALSVYSETASPDAREEAIEGARAARDRAAAALEEARAELVRQQAYLMGVEEGGMGWESRRVHPGVPTVIEQRRAAVEAALAEVASLQRDYEDATFHLEELLLSVPGGGLSFGGAGTSGDPSFEGIPTRRDQPLAVPSIGGGGAVADQFQSRLEAIMTGLRTEAEVIEDWYAASLETLEEGWERRLLTEEQYLEARERLEEEYARRSAQIEGMRQQNILGQVTEGFQQIIGAMGQGNSRMLRIAQGFSAAMAFIDTLAGAARELRAGVFGFASAAAVIAKGAAFVNAIQSANESGRNAFPAAGGMGGAGGGMAALPVQRFVVNYSGPQSGRMAFEELIGSINEAQRQGYRIQGIVQ